MSMLKTIAIRGKTEGFQAFQGVQGILTLDVGNGIL